MALIETEAYFDPEDYLDEVSTEALQQELKKRDLEKTGPLTEAPHHTVTDLRKAFESKNPHEFYYLLRKVEQLLEFVDG